MLIITLVLYYKVFNGNDWNGIFEVNDIPINLQYAPQSALDNKALQ